jgi:hypothetical protein
MTTALTPHPGASLAGARHLIVRRPFWQWFDRKLEVLAPDGSLVAYVEHPILRLREELTIYGDRARTAPMLFVKVRRLLTLNHCYDVFEPAGGARIGSLRRRGVRSLVRDTWDVLDGAEQPIGRLEEQGRALLRRLLPILPARHRLEIAGEPVAHMRQVFRLFVKEFQLDLGAGASRVDPRFALACCLLVLLAEASREDD